MYKITVENLRKKSPFWAATELNLLGNTTNGLRRNKDVLVKKKVSILDKMEKTFLQNLLSCYKQREYTNTVAKVISNII